MCACNVRCPREFRNFSLQRGADSFVYLKGSVKERVQIEEKTPESIERAFKECIHNSSKFPYPLDPNKEIAHISLEAYKGAVCILEGKWSVVVVKNK